MITIDEAERRGVFAYHDGVKDKYADPMRVYSDVVKTYESAPASFDEDLDVVDKSEGAGDPSDPVGGPEVAAPSAPSSEDVAKLYQAIDRLVEVTRRVFRTVPFDEDTGAGLTCEDHLALLYRFLTWHSSKQAADEPEPEEKADVPVELPMPGVEPALPNVA